MSQRVNLAKYLFFFSLAVAALGVVAVFAYLVPLVPAQAEVLPAAKTDKRLQVGDAAPDFKLPGSDGKTYKLADFRGKKLVVLAWFPKAFTGGCTRECRAFAESAPLYADLPVAYFTASVDTPEENKRFAESLGAEYPILSDPEKEVARAYGVVDEDRPLPQRWTYIIGLDGKILHIDKDVKVDTHPKDVLKVIQKLLVEKDVGEQ